MRPTDKNWVVIILARFQSSRFPGETLVETCGISLIERVWRQCILEVEEGWVYMITNLHRGAHRSDMVGKWNLPSYA